MEADEDTVLRDGLVGEFATYEDYLDSQISSTDIYYLEDEDLARQLVVCNCWPFSQMFVSCRYSSIPEVVSSVTTPFTGTWVPGQWRDIEAGGFHCTEEGCGAGKDGQAAVDAQSPRISWQGRHWFPFPRCALLTSKS